MHTRPDVSADRVLNADAPNRDCLGAMARVKAALAAGCPRCARRFAALTRTMPSRVLAFIGARPGLVVRAVWTSALSVSASDHSAYLSCRRGHRR